ncbi:MAG TPA: protein kinase [Gemmatimonadales bacterium]|nr:protein kinase [Gemmatimonadales bacterium]
MTRSFQDQLQQSLGDAYRIERELGGGGMSRVFLAQETALQRQVVVKVLLPELAAGVSVERFRREIHLAAQLQHPHIVPLIAAGEYDGLPYFTMPYVDGESLRARLLRERELPVPEAVRVLRDVASALAYAHARGVVHRDIKPDNVLLSHGAAVVTDFGVAKALTASSAYGGATLGPGLTSMGVTLGTPHYMAPEQGTGDPAMDHRVDLYAFGATAYEVLTGEPPFTGNSPHAILGAHIAALARPITQRRPGLPPMLGHIVMKCLEKRPADRPQSADEIIRALDTLATPTGGTVPLPAVSGPRRTWSGEHAVSPVRRYGLAAAAVALAVVVALLVWPRDEAPPLEPVSEGPAVATEQAPVTAAPVPAPAPAPPAVALDTFRPETTAPVRRPPPPAPPARGPSAEDAALLARLRAEAEVARGRAVAAGAPESVLARGDSSLSRAESLAERQRTAAAAAQLSAASTLWSDAAARPRIAAPPVPAAETVRQAPADTVRQTAPQPAPAPPSARERPEPPPPAPAPEAGGQIRALFAEYGAAIESRNVDAIRRVYPGLSAAQSREWEEFFGGVGSIEVELEVTGLEVSGETAGAQLDGVYVFEDPGTRRTRREHVAFQAQLRREGGRWRITSLR